jgi:PhoH-like ATPase
MPIYFFDTCSLLNLQEEAFKSETKFYISSVTLHELENIKTSGTKDEGTKYQARRLLHLLADNEDKYETILFKNEFLNRIAEFDLPATDDTKIIASAYVTFKDYGIWHEGIFVTCDLACKNIAHSLGLKVNFSDDSDIEEYSGYLEKQLNNEDLALFYSEYLRNNINIYNLFDNEYLLIKDENGQIIDKYRWHENEYSQVQFQEVESRMFGRVVPKEGDVYQQLALDSLKNNQITILRGKAGSGKSLLGLAYLFQELEKNRIDKIVMFVNPVATKDSCKFGFLPGDLESKILGSQIGNFLASKLGNLEAVYELIDQHQLVFVTLADSRGYDTSGMNCAIYCTEAQNTNVEHMKLILSRVGENTKVVIEGDNAWQTDLSSYEGKNNGLRRVCEVFKGMDFFGTVTLQKCYRSRIAEKATEL